MKGKSPAYYITPSVKAGEVSFSVDFVLSFDRKVDFVNENKNGYYLHHRIEDRKKILGLVYDLAKKKGK